MNFTLLLQIAWAFFQVGMFTFGGGYAALPLIEKQVVDINHWMTFKEFTDILTIDELTPGPIAINCATFVGTKLAGVPGAISATFGCVLPSVIVALILVKLYYKYRNLSTVSAALTGLKAMVVAAIGSVAISFVLNACFGDAGVGLANLDVPGVILMLGALFVIRKYKPDPIFVLIGCGLLGLVIYPFI